jgi:hypothetical protein
VRGEGFGPPLFFFENECGDQPLSLPLRAAIEKVVGQKPWNSGCGRALWHEFCMAAIWHDFLLAAGEAWPQFCSSDFWHAF